MQQRNNRAVKAVMNDGTVKEGTCLEYGQYGFTFQEKVGAPIVLIKFEDAKEITFPSADETVLSGSADAVPAGEGTQPPAVGADVSGAVADEDQAGEAVTAGVGENAPAEDQAQA